MRSLADTELDCRLENAVRILGIEHSIAAFRGSKSTFYTPTVEILIYFRG